MLWEIVALIDKYEFHEVTKVFTAMCYHKLRRTLPQGCCDYPASWIYICYELD